MKRFCIMFTVWNISFSIKRHKIILSDKGQNVTLKFSIMIAHCTKFPLSNRCIHPMSYMTVLVLTIMVLNPQSSKRFKMSERMRRNPIQYGSSYTDLMTSQY